MLIIYYVALWGAMSLGALLPRQVRSRLAAYAGLLSLFAVATAALYFAFSQWAGIVRSGAKADSLIPQDYLKHGEWGFASFAILLVGVLSPIAAAWITTRLKMGRTTQNVIEK